MGTNNGSGDFLSRAGDLRRKRQVDPNSNTNAEMSAYDTNNPSARKQAQSLQPPAIETPMDGPEGSSWQPPTTDEKQPGGDGGRWGTRRKQTRTPLQESLSRFFRDKRAVVCLCVVAFLVLLSLFGPPIYQHIGGQYTSLSGATIGPNVYHTYYHQELDRQHEGPSAMYWLGTDAIGRDLFARLMQGLLVSIIVAVMVEVVNIVLGISVGVLAGYHGGWIDQVLARFTDLMFAFPGLLFVILIAGILGPWADTHLSNIPIIGPNGNARLLLVSMAIAFTAWPLMARYVRGQAMQLKSSQYVEAARTAGSTDFTIITRHIVPNLISIVVVASTLNISGTIVGEAGISFLGLGVQPPGSSIGLMIANASQFVDTHPWEILLPAMTMVIIVLCFSFLGDGLRDAFDPRSKD